jgi:hypothetical protein
MLSVTALGRRLLTLAVVLVITSFLIPSVASAQRTRILTSSVVSSVSGRHEWYSVEADPENAANLITCGMGRDANDNTNYGFVYFSGDAGTTWNLVLEDKSSKAVNEESCAFGVHGVAYFVADAWKTDDIGHDDPGTSRIWVSRDSGRTWFLGTRTGFTDGSASVVDRNSGPDQNRLYIFFNNLWIFFSSVEDQAALARLPKVGTSTGLISFKEGDQEIAGPVFDPQMYQRLYNGTYMHQNLMLKDGSLLALFWSKGSKETGRANSKTGEGFLFLAQHTDPNREKLSQPVLLFRTPPASVCDSVLTAPAAYDAATNTVYATYLDGSNGKCSLMLTESTDDGLTWSPGHVWTEARDPETRGAYAPPGRYRSFGLARNQEGVMALLWRDTWTSSCWNFAASTDNGKTYSRPIKLPGCSFVADDQDRLSNSYLEWDALSQADESTVADDAKIVIRNPYNLGENHVTGIAVSPDGVFHPVWITSEEGEGQLRAASIAVIKPRDEKAHDVAHSDDGWRYKTNEVKFLYGGSQDYDRSRRVLTESLIIRNSSGETLKAPVRLEIDPSSQLGLIFPLDLRAEGFGSQIAQYMDIDQYLSAGELRPGASTAPIPLRFHFELSSDAKPEDDMLAHISIRLLTKDVKHK